MKTEFKEEYAKDRIFLEALNTLRIELQALYGHSRIQVFLDPVDGSFVVELEALEGVTAKETSTVAAIVNYVFSAYHLKNPRSWEFIQKNS